MKTRTQRIEKALSLIVSAMQNTIFSTKPIYTFLGSKARWQPSECTGY